MVERRELGLNMTDCCSYHPNEVLIFSLIFESMFFRSNNSFVTTNDRWIPGLVVSMCAVEEFSDSDERFLSALVSFTTFRLDWNCSFFINDIGSCPIQIVINAMISLIRNI